MEACRAGAGGVGLEAINVVYYRTKVVDNLTHACGKDQAVLGEGEQGMPGSYSPVVTIQPSGMLHHKFCLHLEVLQLAINFIKLGPGVVQLSVDLLQLLLCTTA